MSNIGIYCFTNKINNLKYIGQSKHISKRKLEHFRDDIKLKTEFGKALVEFGSDNFYFEILENCSIEELNEKEKYWINYYNTYKNGYNMTFGGSDIIDYEKNRAIPIEKVKECWDNNFCVTNIIKKFNCSSQQAVRNQLFSLGVSEKEIEERGKEKKKKPKRCKKVTQMTLNNEKIAEYYSINEASRITGIESRNIGKVCRNERNHAGGYKWKYCNGE